jgi:phage baseplate assembly protein W
MTNDQSTDRNFIGRGWSFPPQFDIASKSVVMTEDIEDINNSLHILLSTMTGERVMDMRYGCNLDALVFESLDTSTITYIKTKIETAILFYEARIEVKSIDINTEDILEGLILIEVDYIVSLTNNRYNFVFPFYKEEGTEIPSLVPIP